MTTQPHHHPTEAEALPALTVWAARWNRTDSGWGAYILGPANAPTPPASGDRVYIRSRRGQFTAAALGDQVSGRVWDITEAEALRSDHAAPEWAAATGKGLPEASPELAAWQEYARLTAERMAAEFVMRAAESDNPITLERLASEHLREYLAVHLAAAGDIVEAARDMAAGYLHQ